MCCSVLNQFYKIKLLWDHNIVAVFSGEQLCKHPIHSHCFGDHCASVIRVEVQNYRLQMEKAMRKNVISGGQIGQ
jgi:hypothetical protein